MAELAVDETSAPSQGSLGVLHGAALYVGALIGPGLLLVPALAVQAAGAASIVAWAGLLVLLVTAAGCTGGPHHPNAPALERGCLRSSWIGL